MDRQRMGAPQTEPLRFGQKPLVTALGIGRERRLLAHRSPVMVAIDPGGREIPHPAELLARHREIFRMLPQHRIAIRIGRCGREHMRDALECGSVKLMRTVEDEPAVTLRRDLLCTTRGAARGGNRPSLRRPPRRKHPRREAKPKAKQMGHSTVSLSLSAKRGEPVPDLIRERFARERKPGGRATQRLSKFRPWPWPHQPASPTPSPALRAGEG